MIPHRLLLSSYRTGFCVIPESKSTCFCGGCLNTAAAVRADLLLKSIFVIVSVSCAISSAPLSAPAAWENGRQWNYLSCQRLLGKNKMTPRVYSSLFSFFFLVCLHSISCQLPFLFHTSCLPSCICQSVCCTNTVVKCDLALEQNQSSW